MTDGWSVEVFERYVVHDTNGGCWLWSGYVQDNGYASKTVNRKTSLAHRKSYELFKGPVPEGLVIDHKCKIRCCVNPFHLEAVTYAENNRRSPRKKPLKDRCKRGHLFEENPCKNGSNKWRRCGQCSREIALACYYRKKSKNA